MNLNKRQQLLAVLAIVAVAIFVADKLVLTPLTSSWKARAQQLEKLKDLVSEGTILTEEKRAQDIRKQWDRMHTNSLAWEIIQTKPIAAAKPEAESQMLKAFESWANAGGVAVSSIRPQWKEAEDDYNCEYDPKSFFHDFVDFG